MDTSKLKHNLILLLRVFIFSWLEKCFYHTVHQFLLNIFHTLTTYLRYVYGQIIHKDEGENRARTYRIQASTASTHCLTASVHCIQLYSSKVFLCPQDKTQNYLPLHKCNHPEKQPCGYSRMWRPATSSDKRVVKHGFKQLTNMLIKNEKDLQPQIISMAGFHLTLFFHHPIIHT